MVLRGIENYSRHLSQRAPGSKPYTLMDYSRRIFSDSGRIACIDPADPRMYFGDRSRKENLVEYGFRLPSALDNRPLQFNEFEGMVNQILYTSATPGPYEMERAEQVVEQVIRPTALLDPPVTVRPTKNQIDDLLTEIDKTTKRGERTLITTLTKRMAEDLTAYLQEIGIRVTYMHSDILTIERMRLSGICALANTMLGGGLIFSGRAGLTGSIPDCHIRCRQGRLPAVGNVPDSDDWPCCPEYQRPHCYVCGRNHGFDAKSDR